MGLKGIIKPLVPPVIWKLLARTRPRVRWQGSYPTWEEANKQAIGYSDPSILERVEGAVAAVIAGKAAYERDGVLFHEPEPNLGLLAALSQISLNPGQEVKVIDFGGSLGSTYLQNRPWLNTFRLNWFVIEQGNFVASGKKLFPNGPIRFSTNAAELPDLAQPKLLLLSSVLQYLPDPMNQLKSLITQENPEWLFLDRVAFWPGKGNRLTLQTVPPTIYSARYPCWFFDKEILESALSDKYEKIFGFPALDRCEDFPSSFEGSFWRCR